MNNSVSKAPAAHRQRFFYGWYLVAVTWLASFLVTASAIGIFFKPILDEFHWDRATLSLISSIVLLIIAALSPFLGRLIDRFGTRIILIVNSVAQVLSCITYGLAHSFTGIYIGRFLNEIKPTHASQVLVNQWFTKRKGQALGILSTGTPLGQLVLSPVSQYLILIWGWRETLFFWAAISALLIVPVLLWVRNDPREKGLLPDGEIKASTPKIPAISSRAAAVAPALKFNLSEAIHNRSFWLIFGAHFICGISCGLFATHTVIFATDLGYSPLIGASFLSVQGGVSLLGVLVTGWLSDRMARNKVLSMTHLIRSLSLFLIVITILAAHGSLWMLYLAMALFGFGWFTTSPLVGGLIADLYGNLRIGTILGLMLSSHIVGTAIGTYAGGITFQLTGSYQLIFLITGIAEFIACVLTFMVTRPTSK